MCSVATSHFLHDLQCQDMGRCATATTWAPVSTLVTLASCRSYLGFGLMAARAATLDWEATAAANPCVPLDHTGSFEYGNKHHELHAAKQGCAHAPGTRRRTRHHNRGVHPSSS